MYSNITYLKKKLMVPLYVYYLQGDISKDWIVVDSDKDVLALDCPVNLQDVKEEDIVVWVDPLDGTSEYTQGTILQM